VDRGVDNRLVGCDFTGVGNNDFVEVGGKAEIGDAVTVAGWDISEAECSSDGKGLLSTVDKVCCSRTAEGCTVGLDSSLLLVATELLSFSVFDVFF